MDAQFWIDAWNEGRTGFHQAHYHPKLVQYFSQLNPQQGQKVLVPLCGKTKDMLWLHEQGLEVHGVELFEQAVESFFQENKLAPVHKTQVPNFLRFTYKNIAIDCGDFFKLPLKDHYDFVYDRASLVALPEEMRPSYAQVLTQALKKGGQCLLIVFEYDQQKVQGPPFSIQLSEIHKLYGDQFSIKLLESTELATEGSKFAAAGSFQENIYLLEKKIND